MARQRSPHRLDRADILALLWLAGASGLAMTIAWANLNFRRRVRQTATRPSEEISACWESCGAQLGLRNIPQVVCTSAISNPALFGLWRGRLLLPSDFGRGLSVGERQMILMHELAHCRRRDLIVGWMMAVLRVIHWFNPMVWLATAAWRSDAEAACDHAVLNAVDARGRIDYGLTLLKMATRTNTLAPAPALGIIGSERQLRRRIGAIVRTDRPWRIAAVAILAFVALVGLTDARSRARAATPSSQPGNPITISAKFLSVSSDLVAGPGIIDVDAFLKSAGPDSVISSPRIKANDGQKAVMSVGTARNYISDLTAITAPGGTISYKAKTATIQDGLEWSVTPKAMADGQITLDMEIKFTRFQGFKDVPWHQNPALLIQVPQTEIRSIASKLVIPDGKQAVILGPDADKMTNVIIVTATVSQH